MKTLIFLPALFIFLPSIKCVLLQTGVGINNIDFTDFKITENNLNHGVAHNVNGCSIRCLENFQCLSFSFNWKTNACEMWDEDFIHINATDGSADVGWIYYYIIRDFKITENNLNHGVAHNVNGCSIRCLENFQCLSFSFNWKTNACEMWDEDFIHINATDGSADVGWIYYYIIRDLECGITKETCLSRGFSYTPCFCYRYASTKRFYQDALDMCAFHNSSLARVNRGFFQLTLENILAHVNDGEVRIQGDRANITSTWRFDNGDLMKYFNWNTIDNQPSQTPTELSIVIRKSEGYRWHDAHIDYALSSVCHIY